MRVQRDAQVRTYEIWDSALILGLFFAGLKDDLLGATEKDCAC